MTILKKIDYLLPILYPEFYTVIDNSNNELVFLKTEEKLISEPFKTEDKTQSEAFINHFHICGRVSKSEYILVEKIGKIVAYNLLERLKLSFPQKKFVVYLEINYKDSTIIRFHQLWKDEPPYFDLSVKYRDSINFEYKN